MRRCMSTLGALAVAVAILAAPAAGGRAQDDFKPEEGFEPLFNGKDLTGWSYKGSNEKLDDKARTTDGRIRVVEGVIAMMPKDDKGKAGIKELTTIRKFPRPFHLKLEFRAGPKADSGVYVRGPQLQVRDFVRRKEQKHLKKFKNDDWNTLDVIVRDNVTTMTVNSKALSDKDSFSLTRAAGKTTATLNGKSIDPKSVQLRIGAVASCFCNGEPIETMTNIPNNGGIGLQAEAGKFEFRRVRVKEMK